MQKKRFKIAAAAILVVLLAAMMAGCGSVTIAKPQMSENATQVSVDGSCDISLNGDTFTVSGETNILDGALLHVSVVSQDGMIVDYVTMTKNGDQISHDFKITSEKYDDTVKIVTGFITCAPTLYGQQPDAIYAAYGKKFENLDGPEGDIIWNGDGVVALFGSESIKLAE